MRIAINHETTAATRARDVESPLGAAYKRELATLTANLDSVRLSIHGLSAWQRLAHDRLDTLESRPLIVNQAVKGEKGDKGEPGRDGETRTIVVADPDYAPGAWYRFWRRWLLGVNT